MDQKNFKRKESIAMKMIVFFILILVLGVTSINGQEYSAMTYNIRYSTPNDGENWWEFRKEWVANLVNFYEPDVMGIQEGLHTQVQFLDSALVNYDFVGVGRDDGKEVGEFAAIFYHSDKLEVLDSGTFWLSETSDVPSFGWGANFRRIATWAKFKTKKTEEEFWVFNAHLDHETPLARLNAVRLIAEKAEVWNQQELPVIVMGDLNALPESPPIQYLSSKMNDSKLESKTTPIGPIGTYNGFDVNHPLDNRIDYIFVDKSINIQKYAVISETREYKTPSDHLPVFIKFTFN